MHGTQKMFDVTVVGGVGIDTNIYFYTDGIDFDVEANFTENIDYVGQAGGYYSRGFAQLGYKTAFIGHVGNDHLGFYIKEELLGDGINIDGLGNDSKGTKRSINFMYSNGNRKNFYDGKGHMEIKANLKSDSDILFQSILIHFNLMNWSRELLPIAKEYGKIISCDLQDVVDLNVPYREDFIKYADILFFSSTNYPDPTPIVNKILSLNFNPELIIVIGRGNLGCAVVFHKKMTYYKPVELEDLPIIDTNGAGDELAVGFLSSFIFDKKSINESVIRGQICARYTCSIRANSSNLIKKHQLDNFFVGFDSKIENYIIKRETLKL